MQMNFAAPVAKTSTGLGCKLSSANEVRDWGLGSRCVLFGQIWRGGVANDERSKSGGRINRKQRVDLM